MSTELMCLLVFKTAHGDIVKFNILAGTAYLENSTYHPEFGRAIPATCLVVALEGGASHVEFRF